MAASKDKPKRSWSMPRKYWPRSRCPELETGRNSVRPNVTAYCDDIEPGGAVDTLGRTRVPKTGEVAPTVNREGHCSGAVGPTSLQSAVAVVCWGGIGGLELLKMSLLDARKYA